MEDAIFIMSALNLIVSFFIYIKILVIGKPVVKKNEKNVSEKIQAKPEVSEEEKQRIEREAKRKAEQWNNFFSYTGESQMKGGD